MIKRGRNRRELLNPPYVEPIVKFDGSCYLDVNPDYFPGSVVGMRFLSGAALRTLSSSVEPNFLMTGTGFFFNFWINFITTGTRQTIISKRAGVVAGTAGWQISVNVARAIEFISQNTALVTQVVTSPTLLTVGTLAMVSVNVDQSVAGTTTVSIYINGALSITTALAGDRYTGTTSRLCIGALDNVTQRLGSAIGGLLTRRERETGTSNITSLRALGVGISFEATAALFPDSNTVGYWQHSDANDSIWPDRSLSGADMGYHPSSVALVSQFRLFAPKSVFYSFPSLSVPSGYFTLLPESYSELCTSLNLNTSQENKNLGLGMKSFETSSPTDPTDSPVIFTESHGAVRKLRGASPCLFFDGVKKSMFSSGSDEESAFTDRAFVDFWIVFSGDITTGKTELFSADEPSGGDKFTVVLDGATNPGTIAINFRQYDYEPSPQAVSLVATYPLSYQMNILRIQMDYENALLTASLNLEPEEQYAMTEPAGNSDVSISKNIFLGTGPLSSFHNGDIARVLTFNSRLAPTQASYLFNYLRKKYDVPVRA